MDRPAITVAVDERMVPKVVSDWAGGRIRHGLTALGAYLIARGADDGAVGELLGRWTEPLVGAALVALGQAWSMGRAWVENKRAMALAGLPPAQAKDPGAVRAEMLRLTWRDLFHRVDLVRARLERIPALEDEVLSLRADLDSLAALIKPADVARLAQAPHRTELGQ